MKGNIRTIITVLCLSGFFSIIALCKTVMIIWAAVQPTYTFTYSFDTTLASTARHAIQTYVEQHDTLSSQALINGICAEFNYVYSCQLAYKPSGAHIQINAHTLAYAINDQLVANQDGTLFAKEVFKPTLYATLKKISVPTFVPTSQEVPSLLHQWICHAPPTIFSQYAVCWLNEHIIELTDLDDAQFVIRCTHNQTLDATTLQSYRTLKNELSTHALRQHDTSSVIADIRFEGQIILSKK